MSLLTNIFPKKIILDANIVIRYLIKDSVEQSSVSAEIISNIYPQRLL